MNIKHYCFKYYLDLDPEFRFFLSAELDLTFKDISLVNTKYVSLETTRPDVMVQRYLFRIRIQRVKLLQPV